MSCSIIRPFSCSCHPQGGHPLPPSTTVAQPSSSAEEQSPHPAIKEALLKRLSSEITLLTEKQESAQIAAYTGLLKKVQSVTTKNDLYITAKGAIKAGISNAAQLFIESGFGLTEIDERNGESLLHEAAAYNNLNAAAYLVQSAVAKFIPQFASRKDKNGVTPLHWAMRYNRPDMVKFLVEVANADVTVKGLLDHAILKESLQAIVQFLDSAKPSKSILDKALMQAVLRNKLKIGAMLIERKANVNVNLYSEKHSTPLTIAFERGYEDMVYLLVNKGAKFHPRYQMDERIWLLLWNFKRTSKLTLDQIKEAYAIVDKIPDLMRMGNKDELKRQIRALHQLTRLSPDEMLELTGIESWAVEEEDEFPQEFFKRMYHEAVSDTPLLSTGSLKIDGLSLQKQDGS